MYFEDGCGGYNMVEILLLLSISAAFKDGMIVCTPTDTSQNTLSAVKR